jgi:hypothetical protein
MPASPTPLTLPRGPARQRSHREDSPAIGIGQAQIARVQGIDSSIDDIVLDGGRFQSRIGSAITDAEIDRTMTGASTVQLSIKDDNDSVLTSPLLEKGYGIEVDDLDFIFVQAKNAGLSQPLGLIHESRVIHRLRQFIGPVKAFRDQLTRAEFLQRLTLIAAKGWDPIPFHSHELHKAQPIRTPRDQLRAQKQSMISRGGGIAAHAHLTVKGNAATAHQIAIGDRALRTAESYSPSLRVLVALMAALITESEVGATSSNVLQAAGAGIGAPVGSVEEEVAGFLTGKHWTQTGAIQYANANPNAKPYEIAQAVQASGAGAASNGKANYGPYVDEGRRWVEAYGGSTGISVSVPQRFPFEVKKKETFWKAMTRLADEVNWALFEVNGAIYYEPETYLVQSQSRVLVKRGAAGIEDIGFDYDTGKPINTVNVKARSNDWVAPPGAVATVHGRGPADGDYLVANIKAPLRHKTALCDVTLQRATKPLPEPAPTTKSTSISGTGNLATDKMIAEIDALNGKFRYVWGGGHQDIVHRLAGYDCSGFISHILYVGGLLKSPVTSGVLAHMYQPGEGDWLTIYANSTHVFAKIKTPTGWKYFQSGGADNSTGWVPAGKQDPTGGFSARHPKGF